MSAPLFRRILVPYDFSPPAARALAAAADLAAETGGRIHVLHVIQPVYPPPEIAAWIPEPNLVPTTRKRLEAAVAKATKGRKVPIFCRVVVGNPLDRITAAARACDSIVMATHGRTGIGRLLIGSVAEKVVRHAPVPVLTLRAGGRRGR